MSERDANAELAAAPGSAISNRAKLVRLLCACDGLLEIVEGCLGERWTSDDRRLVDTKAWCEFYLAHRAVQNAAGTGETPPNAQGSPTANVKGDHEAKP